MGNLKKRNSFRYYDPVNKRWLYGNAAYLKITSEAGGADAFVADIARIAIEVATPTIVAQTIEKYSRPNLKVI